MNRPWPAARHLLPLLQDARHCRTMLLADWDDTIRLARQARVLGPVAHRLRDQDELWASLHPRVRGHLQAAIHYSAYRLQLLRIEMHALDAALPRDLPVALLKGASYLLQNLPMARGRMPNDVDILVARADLDAAEAALRSAGWKMEAKSAYDERYYREWSHELPPMRYPGHPLEVDLHHTIAPVTSRTRADDELLFEGLRSVPGSRFLVLDPCDQVIHAAIHLFQDSELHGQLRGLVDVDGLVRQHLGDNSVAWRRLVDRAERHRAARVLWYALHYGRGWLGTPVPEELALEPPPRWARWGMDWVFSRACPPRIPDVPPRLVERLADGLGLLRYHRLRMPPTLLARHVLHKTRMTLTPRAWARGRSSST